MKEFKPTEGMIIAAKAVFTAQALVLTIRPVVEANHKKVLAENDYLYEERLAERKNIPMQPIRDSKDDWMMNEKDFFDYIDKCTALNKAAGLKTDGDSCPLLVAEDLERQANRVLIDAMEPITRISADTALNAGLDVYKKIIDISLNLLVKFVRQENF